MGYSSSKKDMEETVMKSLKMRTARRPEIKVNSVSRRPLLILRGN